MAGLGEVIRLGIGMNNSKRKKSRVVRELWGIAGCTIGEFGVWASEPNP